MSDSSQQIIGAGPPPPGIVPNFEHPAESMAVQVILAAVLCPVFTLFFVGLRLYTARTVIGRLQTDDCERETDLPGI
jgi:hypothetical protein